MSSEVTPSIRDGHKPRLGYHVHYVVNGGRSRIVLDVLVTLPEVME